MKTRGVENYCSRSRTIFSKKDTISFWISAFYFSDEDVLVSTVITFTSYTTLSQLLTFLETTSDLVTQALT